MSTVQTATANTAKANKANATNVTSKAKAPKAKKVNPLKDARKAMLGKVKEERQSLTDCIRLLGLFGGAWIKEVGLTPQQFKALTPTALRPHQLDTERYKAVLIHDGGEAERVESGWTPTKVANAVERMQVAAIKAKLAK